MKILLLGANGQVGFELQRALAPFEADSGNAESPYQIQKQYESIARAEVKEAGPRPASR